MGFRRKVFKGFSGGDFTGGRGRNTELEKDNSGLSITEQARRRDEVKRKLEEYKEQIESERQDKFARRREVEYFLKSYVHKVPEGIFRFEQIEFNNAVVICPEQGITTRVFVERPSYGTEYIVYRLAKDQKSRQDSIVFGRKDKAKEYALKLAYLEVEGRLDDLD